MKRGDDDDETARLGDDSLAAPPSTDDALLREALGMSARAAPAHLAPGQLVDGAYLVERELGAGGMGRVYLAKDVRLGRDVAIKLHAAAVGEGASARLLREATALARLTHPNVVTVYEIGMWSGHPWVAMEYVRGGTARTWQRTAKRTPREVLALYLAAGEGLAAAHAAGLVHRDFKPDNVLVGEDGRARVADFGLAREAGERAALDEPGSSPVLPGVTRTGAVMGTPAYMAPEQWTGEPVGPAADQFAFAVALWEALAGTRPFGGATDEEIVAALARRPADPPAGRMPGHVERALRRALARDPAARWPSMRALLDELRRDLTRARLVLGGGAVLGLAAAVAWYATRDPLAACDTLDVELAAAGELAPLADDARRTYRDVAREACRAADEARTTAVQACLAHHVDVTRALLATGDTTLVLRAPPLAECRGLAAWASRDARLDTASIFVDEGALPRAREAAARLVGAPRALVDGGLALRARRPREAIARLGEAAGDPATRLAAAVQLVAAHRLAGDPAAIRRAIEATIATSADAPPDAAFEALVAAADARIALGEAEPALELLAQAAALVPAEPRFTAVAHLVRARAYAQLGRYDNALLGSTEHVQRVRERYGAKHPRVGRALVDQAAVLSELGRTDDVRALYRAAIPLLAADESLPTAEALLELATALADDGDAAADAQLWRARVLLVAHHGERHADVARADVVRALRAIDAKDPSAALRLLEPATATLGEALGDHVELARALYNTAAAQRQLGRLDDAVATATRAVAITERVAHHEPEHLRAQLLLAALWNDRGQHGAAVELAMEVGPRTSSHLELAAWARFEAGRGLLVGTPPIAPERGRMLLGQARVMYESIGLTSRLPEIDALLAGGSTTR